MIEGLIIGLVIGAVVGFIVSMELMRWAVSDLRTDARRAIKFKNQAEEIAESLKIGNRALRREKWTTSIQATCRKEASQ